MFKVSGIWVSPFEIEEALMGHAKVAEAAVIPAEDVDGLIKPKAFVVLDRGGGWRNRRAVRRTEGTRQALDRPVEISTLDPDRG